MSEYPSLKNCKGCLNNSLAEFKQLLIHLDEEKRYHATLAICTFINIYSDTIKAENETRVNELISRL